MRYLFSFFLIFTFSLPQFGWAENPQLGGAQKINLSSSDQFLTDAPVPFLPGRVTLDFYSYITKTKAGSTTNTPSLEANVGVLPDLQLYTITPATLAAPKHKSTQYGYGDVKVGAKFRFFHDQASNIDLALYPKITLPSGDSKKGLGNGTWIGRFPIWIQKEWGDWRVSAGGGYYVNRAKGQRNYPFGGALIRWQITECFMLGNELFAEGKRNAKEKANLIYNFGGSYFLNSHSFLNFAVGHSIAGGKQFVAWVGWGVAWGPEAPR